MLLASMPLTALHTLGLRGHIGTFGCLGGTSSKFDLRINPNAISNAAAEAAAFHLDEDAIKMLPGGGISLGLGKAFGNFVVEALLTGRYQPMKKKFSSEDAEANSHTMKSDFAFDGGLVFGYRVQDFMPFVRLSACLRRFTNEFTSEALTDGDPAILTFSKSQNFWGFSLAIGVMWRVAAHVELGVEGGIELYQKRSFDETKTYDVGTTAETENYFLKITQQPRSFELRLNLRWCFG